MGRLLLCSSYLHAILQVKWKTLRNACKFCVWGETEDKKRNNHAGPRILWPNSSFISYGVWSGRWLRNTTADAGAILIISPPAPTVLRDTHSFPDCQLLTFCSVLCTKPRLKFLGANSAWQQPSTNDRVDVGGEIPQFPCLLDGRALLYKVA